MRREGPSQPFETTALVHETYLRLAELERMGWKDRAHFFAMSARLMRQILVDVARARLRQKRSALVVNLSLSELGSSPAPVRPPNLLDLDDALRDLAAADGERARIVELKFFGGMGREEIAEVMGISSATVSRRWRSARAWLLHYLAEQAK